ncbi:MAG: Ig-like domain-containing protein, partial [Sinobacterium sp.]|nr:Ig-like domain-containing protein [Sinobacterium sp.]
MSFIKPLKYSIFLCLYLLLSACGSESNSGFPRADCGAHDNLCINSLAITPKFSSILIDGEKPFRAIATLTDGSEKDISRDVTWSVGDESIAKLNLGDSQVVATGLKAGITTISVSYRGMQSVAQLSVGVISYSITPVVSTILTAMTQKYQAFAILPNGLQLDVTASVTWTIDDEAVASLTATGEEVVVTGLAIGKANILASYAGHSISAALNVINEAPNTLLISPIGAVIPAGTLKQYSAFVTTPSGAVIDVTDNVVWRITDSSIVSIDDDSLVSAIKIGSTPINATFEHEGATIAADEATINVSSGVVDKLTITPNNGKFP